MNSNETGDVSKGQMLGNFVCYVKQLGFYPVGMGNLGMYADEWCGSSKIEAKSTIPFLVMIYH